MKLTLTELLNAKKPSDIFTSEEDKKKQYRILMQMFHPDTRSLKNVSDKDADEICRIINHLYSLPFNENHNGIFYEHLINIDIGVLLDNSNSITYDVSNIVLQNKFPSFEYENESEEKRIKPFLPELPNIMSTNVSIVKPKGVYNLSLVLKALDNKLEPQHSAWIIGRLFYLSSYLYTKKLVNNALTINDIYIHPENHLIWIPNWFLSRKYGEKLIGVNRNVFNNLPKNIRNNKTAINRIDTESIHFIGRQLKFEGHSKKYLEMPANNNPIISLEEWYKALEKDFGKRKFHKFPTFKL